MRRNNGTNIAKDQRSSVKLRNNVNNIRLHILNYTFPPASSKAEVIA